ncbi:hypothetical protein PAGA_a2855 [Pseudoalteromonas agarivorans DSM 14585]|uniref:Uncharacterized protein n=1 Tax=Pseudoalteromonas agarivorans DSM 14585 TaxID=1312369 RepID=A0ACA8DYE0_9GAMM|nr:hypothetical protein PAGA_a2855 [Pseudoalteromonas agarivorans DSM 14585]
MPRSVNQESLYVCEDVVSVKGGSSSVVTEFGLFLFVRLYF